MWMGEELNECFGKNMVTLFFNLLSYTFIISYKKLSVQVHMGHKQYGEILLKD